MRFKGIYKDKSSEAKLGILFLLMIVSLIMHTMLAIALTMLFSDNGMTLIRNQDLTNQISVNYLKLMQLFSGIGLFIIPTLFYSYLTNFEFKFSEITRQDTILVVTIMMLVTPFVGLLLEWNMEIPFPEWFVRFDINSQAIVKAFLNMPTLLDLVYTLLVIAVVPAIGEELLFRGYVQQKMWDWIKNPHFSILITGFLFSVIHLDPYGIIPRFVLGVLLGYLYYWSGNLWLPILAHFVNNAQAIIFSYHLFKLDVGAYSIFSETKIDPILAFFSLASVMLLLYILYKNININKE